MTDFTSDWLTLREPVDARSRSARLTRLIADRCGTDAAVRVLDVATGTGSNLRYLFEFLAPQQSWIAVDRDPVLLAHIPVQISRWALARGFEVTSLPEGLLVRGDRFTCRIATRREDLAGAFDGAGATDLFDGQALVTASALLDLVSDRWLRAVADQCRAARAAVLFALTYDGRVQCSPEEPEDAMIRDLVNTHQRTDKGFGAALGPGATEMADRCFTRVGYHVHRVPSDWVLGPDASELQEQLIEGWTEAAVACAAGQSSSIRSWRTRRLAHVAAGRSRLLVGHEDLAAWLPRRAD